MANRLPQQLERNIRKSSKRYTNEQCFASNVSSQDCGQDTLINPDTIRGNGDIKREEDNVAAGSHPILHPEISNESGISATILASRVCGSYCSYIERPTFANFNTACIKREEDDVTENFPRSHPVLCAEFETNTGISNDTLTSIFSNTDSERPTFANLDTLNGNGDITKGEDDVAAASQPFLSTETRSVTGNHTDRFVSNVSSNDIERPTFAYLGTVCSSGDVNRAEDDITENFTDARPLSCTEPGCRKHFGRLDHLKRHMLIHTGQKMKCSYVSCTRVFRDKYALRLHTQSVHEQAEPFVCSEGGCDQKFKTRIARKRHQMDSHGKVAHQCQYCSKNFLQKHLLDGHMTLHTGVKQYACKDCQKEFSYKHNLVAHIKNKSCSKPSSARVAHFFCQEEGCGKGYGDKRCLKRHVEAAHHSTVFKCENCNKVFSYASSLSRHRLNCN